MLAFVIVLLPICSWCFAQYTIGQSFPWVVGHSTDEGPTAAGFLLGAIDRRCSEVRFVRFWFRCNVGEFYREISFAVYNAPLLAGKDPLAFATNQDVSCTGNWQSVNITGNLFTPDSHDVYGFYGCETGESLPTMWSYSGSRETVGELYWDFGHDLALDGLPDLQYSWATSDLSAIFVEYETQCTDYCDVGASVCGSSCGMPCDFGCSSLNECYECDDFGSAKCSGKRTCCNDVLHDCVDGIIMDSGFVCPAGGCENGRTNCSTDPCDPWGPCVDTLCCNNYLHECGEYGYHSCDFGCDQYSDHCREDWDCELGSVCAGWESTIHCCDSDLVGHCRFGHVYLSAPCDDDYHCRDDCARRRRMERAVVIGAVFGSLGGVAILGVIVVVVLVAICYYSENANSTVTCN